MSIKELANTVVTDYINKQTMNAVEKMRKAEGGCPILLQLLVLDANEWLKFLDLEQKYPRFKANGSLLEEIK